MRMNDQFKNPLLRGDFLFDILRSYAFGTVRGVGSLQNWQREEQSKQYLMVLCRVPQGLT